MPMSDDYGIEDDDTVFIAAATQAEVTQNGGHDHSPRPKKRRRVEDEVEGEPFGSDGTHDSDSENRPEGRRLGGLAKFKYTGEADADHSDHEAESDPEYYFPGEQRQLEEQPAKSTTHRIHIPKNGGYFEQQIFTQTQRDLDSSPSHFRGAIWKRPAQIPAPPLFHSTAMAVQTQDSQTVVNAVQQNATQRNGAVMRQTSLNGTIVNRPSQAAIVPRNAQANDAELARRLQAQEIASNRPAHNHAPILPPQPSRQQIDLAEELADLPSDAFSSSSPEKSPEKEIITISSQPAGTQQQSRGLRGPQQGLKQMNMFGQTATQALTTSQAATKKHAWPLKARDEKATHHKLDAKAMETWVYPTNLGTFRDYQYNIVARSLFHNTLVALPTGLGKTFIAATVMLNYYRWTTDAQIVFMAPTKPLIAQQMEACYRIVGIPRHDTVLMTGETTPGLRTEEWLEKRVFFMTPQTVINDLKSGIADPKKIVLVVVDEAHKASGGYAYTEVIAFLRRFNESFRVHALTATPGSTVEAVQGVIDSLGIARVELRTEQSLDIRQYTHEKQTETEVFEFSDEQQLIMELFTKALQPSLDKLRSQGGYWSRDPMQLNAFLLNQQRGKWMSSDAGRKAPMPLKGMMNNLYSTLASLAHSIGLLKFHGIGPFYNGVLGFHREVESGQKKGKQVTEIAQSEHFVKMMQTLRGWTNNPDFIGHPKLEYLREVVLNHFLDAGEGRTVAGAPPSATRIMVFASYRDSTEEICRVLKRNEPMVRPHVFVGQAASKGSEGMDQKKQNAVIQDFKSGKYNTLVATSIGEEGLDIGDVDLIVCYDASSSPIRMLQRIGRTGRKRVGRVVLLLMKGKEDNDYAKAQDSYSWIQKSIADASRYQYREDQSPRILPKEVQPQVDKRVIEIPVENSQPIDLNEKGKRARGKGKAPKRPPKKFHMPDGVRTGFVKASKAGSDDDGSDAEMIPKRKAAPKKSTAPPKAVPVPAKPEPVQLPFLEDVVLNHVQSRELERNYAQTVTSNEDAVVRAPDPSRLPQTLRKLGPTKYLAHGRAALVVSKAMQAIQGLDNDKVDRMKTLLDINDIEHYGEAAATLASIGQQHQEDFETALPTLSDSPAQPNPGRPRQEKTQRPTTTNVRNPVGQQAETVKAPAKRGRPRKTPKSRPLSYDFAAAEGRESSPEPTPADLRLPTQGIDLGSHDTSGEDEDEEPDSELAEFVVRSDATIEMASSSQLFPDDTQVQRDARQRRTLAKKGAKSQPRIVLPDIDESVTETDDGDSIDDALPVVNNEAASSDVEEVSLAPQKTPPARGPRRRVVDSSDSDE